MVKRLLHAGRCPKAICQNVPKSRIESHSRRVVTGVKDAHIQRTSNGNEIQNQHAVAVPFDDAGRQAVASMTNPAPCAPNGVTPDELVTS